MDKKEFAKQDGDIFPVLTNANDDEIAVIVGLLAEKWSSEVDKNCRDRTLITMEIQSMGGDTIANTARGHGVSYQAIVHDVAKQLKVEFEKSTPVENIEEKVLMKVMENYKQSLNEKERKEFEEEVKKGVESNMWIKEGLNNKEGAAVMLLGAAAGFIARQLAQKGALNAVPFLGQVVAAVLTVISAVIVMTGPATRTLISVVVMVAFIRMRQRHEQVKNKFDV